MSNVAIEPSIIRPEMFLLKPTPASDRLQDPLQDIGLRVCRKGEQLLTMVTRPTMWSEETLRITAPKVISSLAWGLEDLVADESCFGV